MNLRPLYLFLVFSFSTPLLIAQDHQLNPCGTTEGRVPWLRAYQQNPKGFPRNENTLYVPLSIHVVGTSEGTGHFPARKVLDALCTLNNDFEASAIQFFIEGDINYLNNTNWYDHTWSQGSHMMNANFVPNTINCYIVESPVGNCGYSSYNSGVALSKSCMNPTDHTWAHEIGHYLSLPHPFLGWEGYEHNYNVPAPFFIDNRPVEKMDGSNCSYAGDGFCDTPPDYLSDRWPCNSENLSNRLQKDPNGVEFRSDGSLIMSYSSDECASRFSQDQIDAMRANLLTEKQSFLYNQTPLDPPVLNPLTGISPAEGELVPNYNAVHLSWEPVENATRYLLEISPMGTFGVIEGRYEVLGHSFISTDLDPNRKYYWRVRPYNRLHACTDYLPRNSFETGQVTAIKDIVEVSSVAVFPNPSQKGQQVRILLSSTEQLDLQGSVSSLSGKNIQQFQWALEPGNNHIGIMTDQLPTGIYILNLQSRSGVISKKLVINP